MNDLRARIRAAQVHAGERTVVQDLHERGLCDKATCPFCLPVIRHDLIPQTLVDKIVMMLLYCEDLRANRRPRDDVAFNSLLDDPELAVWLTKMRNTGRGRNTRFTG